MTREEALKKMQTFMDFFPAAKSEMQEAIDALCEPKWVSVKEDLPCNHEELVHSNYTDRVLVLSRNGYSEVAFMCIIEDVWEWNTLITVLYWMPIPKF